MDSKLIYQFGRFHLDPKSQTFYFQSDEIKLEPRIFDVLHLMLQRPSEVITKDEFFEYVWQGKVVSDWALSRAIKVLRKTLLKYHEQELVKTLYGRGYLFTPEVKTISQNDFVNANQNTEPNTELNTEPKQNTEQQNSFNEVGNESVKEMIAENQESNSINPQADQPSAIFNAIKFGIGALIIVGAYFLFQGSDKKEAKISSIVVFPITNINDKQDLDYLSNGLTDVITSQLAQNRELRVISRTSAQYYQNSDMTPAEIAEKLNVDGIIEGSIFSADNKLHMNVRLIDAKNEHLVWSFEEEGTLTEIYSFFQKIALEVGTRVNPSHVISGKQKYLVQEKTDRETFELYLKARYLLDRRQGKYLQNAATLLKEAIDKDESFAEAHASLSSLYIVMSSYVVNRNFDYFLLAKKYNDKALQLEPDSSLAWTNLGLIEFGHNYNFEEAQKSFEKAIELEPDNVNARRAYSELLAVISKYPEALSILEETWQKDSMNPLLIAVWGSTLMMDKQFDKALEKFELAKSLGSEMIWIDRDIAYIYQQLGNNEQSLKYRYLEMKNIGYFKEGDKAFVEATTRRGMLGFWQWRLPILEGKWQQNKLHGCNLSEAFAGVKNYQQMLHWFKIGLEQKSENCFQLVKRSPEFYQFKDEPEFKSLLLNYAITL